jgi:hypothetical protein
MSDLQNLILLEYESIKREEEKILTKKFVNSISNEWEVEMNEDSDFSDLYEEFINEDLSNNYLFVLLESRMTPSQKRYARERSKKSQKRVKVKRKPDIPSSSDKIEKIRSEKEKISDQIKSLKDKKEGLDTEKSRDVNAQIKTLDAKKLQITSIQKKEEGDSEKARALSNMAKFKKEAADNYTKWKEVKKKISEISQFDVDLLVQGLSEPKKIIRNLLRPK